METTIRVCAACGSTRCQVTAWVRVNGDALVDGDGPTDGVWCPTCETHDTDLVDVDTSEKLYLFDSDGNAVDVCGAEFSTLADAIQAATDLVLNVWDDIEAASVCLGNDDGESGPAVTVATVTRSPIIAARPRHPSPSAVRVELRPIAALLIGGAS